MKLENQVAIITGSATGFGAAIAKKFATEGAAVVINYPSEDFAERADVVVEEIKSAGGSALAIQADITNWDEVGTMAAKVKADLGSIDILVNNAGVHSNTPLDDLTLERWNKTIAVNLTGPFIMVKHVLPIMVEQGRGNVINIASNAAWYAGLPLDYNASKTGLLVFARTLVKHYGRKGIRSNTIAPGFHRTEMSQSLLDAGLGPDYLDELPVGFIGEPDDLANVALFLASEDSRYVAGHCLIADGGFTRL